MFLVYLQSRLQIQIQMYSQNPRKFKLHRKTFDQEEEMATLVKKLSDEVCPDLKAYTPGAFDNQTKLQESAPECSLGSENLTLPFSSVTICLDFSAHRHKDSSNMVGGCTAVATFFKDGETFTEDSHKEQLHILPQYSIARDTIDTSSSNHRGIGLALTHGSLLFEYAKAKWHAT
jgi:hypothetical protein